MTIVPFLFLIATVLALVALIREEGHQLGTWAIAIIGVALTLLAFGVAGATPLR